MKKSSVLSDHKEKIENKIIDWMAAGSASRLIISKPAVELNSTADLMIEARGEYEINYQVFLNVQSCRKELGKNGFISSIVPGEISPRSGLYFLFVFFDIVSQDIFEYVWLIPAEKFFEIADRKENNAVFEAPLDINIQNKYSEYLINKKELGKILTKIVQAR